MGPTGALAALLLVAARERPEVSAATASPVVIHAPNVATDSMKASAAIREYLDASKERDSVVRRAREARQEAPAAYAEHLGRVQAAQNSTTTALDAASGLQARAAGAAQSELRALESEYQAKAQRLAAGRAGADFGAEARDLKLRLAGGPR
uniref:Uncharacterized protein n=1 Tax=Alexandrium catenella TaxID=2925 RepID=A0A7S1RIW9_ALECA